MFLIPHKWFLHGYVDHMLYMFVWQPHVYHGFEFKHTRKIGLLICYCSSRLLPLRDTINGLNIRMNNKTINSYSYTCAPSLLMGTIDTCTCESIGKCDIFWRNASITFKFQYSKRLQVYKFVTSMLLGIDQGLAKLMKCRLRLNVTLTNCNFIYEVVK